MFEMEQKQVLEAIKKVREGPKKKFLQSIELIINLKEIDTKKEEGKIEEFVVLPAGRGKAAKVCALIGPEMKDIASKICDHYLLQGDFAKLDKREIRKLARDFDYFIAQANVMPDVAKTFARYFSPIGKMPSLKSGHVVPPKANIEPLVKNLRNTVRLVIKKAPVFQTLVGNETMKDEELAQNILTLINAAKARLPQGQHNIRSVLIKTTMGVPIKITA